MAEPHGTRLDPVGSGYHPSASEIANEKEEERDTDHTNLDLLKVQTSETSGDDEGNGQADTEKGQQQQGGGEQIRHVGFWSHDLVNVRLHVLKLWFRTGG